MIHLISFSVEPRAVAVILWQVPRRGGEHYSAPGSLWICSHPYTGKLYNEYILFQGCCCHLDLTHLLFLRPLLMNLTSWWLTWPLTFVMDWDWRELALSIPHIPTYTLSLSRRLVELLTSNWKLSQQLRVPAATRMQVSLLHLKPLQCHIHVFSIKMVTLLCLLACMVVLVHFRNSIMFKWHFPGWSHTCAFLLGWRLSMLSTAIERSPSLFCGPSSSTLRYLLAYAWIYLSNGSCYRDSYNFWNLMFLTCSA